MALIKNSLDSAVRSSETAASTTATLGFASSRMMSLTVSPRSRMIRATSKISAADGWHGGDRPRPVPQCRRCRRRWRDSNSYSVIHTPYNYGLMVYDVGKSGARPIRLVLS